VHPNEDQGCYSSAGQRSILIELSRHPLVREHFFLTGGTALSVFYLHHRTSEDLDFFTVEKVDLSEISFWLRTVWPSEYSGVRTAPQFLSVLLRGVKVEFVIDPLSDRGGRDQASVGSESILVDSLGNIAANKLCTLVSRVEPKDFIDFYFLMQDVPGLEFESLLKSAQEREALLDDFPTAAYQLEQGFSFLRSHENLIPMLKRPVDLDTLSKFYAMIAGKLYQMGKRL